MASGLGMQERELLFMEMVKTVGNRLVGGRERVESAVVSDTLRMRSYETLSEDVKQTTQAEPV